MGCGLWVGVTRRCGNNTTVLVHQEIFSEYREAASEYGELVSEWGELVSE